MGGAPNSNWVESPRAIWWAIIGLITVMTGGGLALTQGQSDRFTGSDFKREVEPIIKQVAEMTPEFYDMKGRIKALESQAMDTKQNLAKIATSLHNIEVTLQTTVAKLPTEFPPTPFERRVERLEHLLNTMLISSGQHQLLMPGAVFRQPGGPPPVLKTK